MTRTASALSLSLLFGLTLSGSVALADGPPQASPSKAQMLAAKSFFDRGQQLYNEGKYEAAWLEFSSAYEIAPLPDLVFNLARCEVKMNRNKEAIAHYREFLAMVPQDPAAPRIRTEIEQLERKMAGLPEQPEPAANAATPVTPPPAAAEPGRKFPLASVLLGGGTALFLIFGGVSVGVATSRYNTLSEPAPTGCKPDCSDGDVANVRTPLNAGYAMFGLAAVAAVATAVVLPLELGLFKKERKVALQAGPGTLGLVGRF